MCTVHGRIAGAFEVHSTARWRSSRRFIGSGYTLVGEDGNRSRGVARSVMYSKRRRGETILRWDNATCNETRRHPVGKPEGNVVWTRSSGTCCAIRHGHGPIGNEPELGGGDQSRDDASRVVADVMVGAEVPTQTRNRDQRVGRQRRRNEVVTNRYARLIAAFRRTT